MKRERTYFCDQFVHVCVSDILRSREVSKWKDIAERFKRLLKIADDEIHLLKQKNIDQSLLIDSIQTENFELKKRQKDLIGNQRITCVICKESNPNCVLTPCRHAQFCAPCIARSGAQKCPICRADVLRVQSIYL
tara:strand:- start:45 stop:449 length:405 start_codon:yes stop_codon:yes gene_type:complete